MEDVDADAGVHQMGELYGEHATGSGGVGESCAVVDEGRDGIAFGTKGTGRMIDGNWPVHIELLRYTRASVDTCCLQALESTTSTVLCTVYLAYMTVEDAQTLQAQLRIQSSALYTQTEGITNQIAAQLNPSVPLDSIMARLRPHRD